MFSIQYLTGNRFATIEQRSAQNCSLDTGVPLATQPGIEDIATKFEQEYVRCVRNEEECVCSVCL
jgi:hypothetical protein